MKRFILILLVAATLPARAQLFGPESISGAFWGSFIGGLVGNNGHCGYSGEGAAIGAGIGLVAGAIAGETRRYKGYGYYNSYPHYPYSYNSSYGYSAPANYYQPARPNYAVGGTLLGAASGALIGASDGKAGPGAAIGAGAGLVLGSIAEITARKRTATAQYVPATIGYEQTSSTVRPYVPRPQYQITSKPVASSTYYWTAPPKNIADAPRVPDAPTF